MAIYGVSFSKFKSGITEVELNHSTINPKWRIPQVIEHKSILTGVINYIQVANDTP